MCVAEYFHPHIITSAHVKHFHFVPATKYQNLLAACRRESIWLWPHCHATQTYDRFTSKRCVSIDVESEALTTRPLKSHRLSSPRQTEEEEEENKRPQSQLRKVGKERQRKLPTSTKVKSEKTQNTCELRAS